MNHVLSVKSQEEIAHNIYKMVIHGPITSKMKTPGQFAHIRVNETSAFMLRRPISISDVDAVNETFTIVYRAGGKGTTELSKLQSGDSVDVLAPLGNGFPVEKSNHVLIVGGGIGVPPLLELSKQLNKIGVKTTHVLGFSSEREVFYEEEFSRLGDTYVATVDGSYGTKGFVTDVIDTLDTKFDKFYSCGPKVMLKVLSETLDMDGYISLEERMGCGFGACYACVADKKDGGQVKLCVDGPVFKKGEIIL